MKKPSLRIAAFVVLLALAFAPAAVASYAEEALPVLQRKAVVGGVTLLATYRSPELEWLEARDTVASDEEATELLRTSWAGKTQTTLVIRLDVSVSEPSRLDWSAVRLRLDSGEEIKPLPFSVLGLPSIVTRYQPVSADLYFPFTPRGPGNPPQAVQLILGGFIPFREGLTLEWIQPLALLLAAKIGVFEADVYAPRPDGAEGAAPLSFGCH